MKESKLESMQEGESLEDERAKLNQEIKEIFQKRVNIMNRIKGCAQQLAEQVRQRTLALLNAAELEAVALAARRAKEQHDQALENVSDAMRRALEEKEEAKRQASMAKEKAEGLWKDNTDEEENELQEVMKRDMEELEDDLNTYRARADLADRASANVVQQYERRKEEVRK